MVQIISSKLYPIQASATNFLSGGKGDNPPNVVLTPNYGEGNRYPVKIIVTSIPAGVTSVIQDLHLRGFADVHGWSPAIKAQSPEEISRIMTKYLIFGS